MIRKVSVPGKSLTGPVSLPASKSAAHRAILCASLAKGISHLSNFSFSQDMEATCRAVEALGVKTSLTGDTLTVDSRSLFAPSQAVLDCGESGSTLRFLIPTAAAGGVRAEFTGRGRLPERPIGVYLDCLPQAGVACRTQGGLPLSISGALRPGVFRLPGNISSQFITGLLLALPILNGGSEIRLTSPLESAGYVDMTIEMMKRFGVTVTPVENGWLVPGNQSYVPRDLAIEGDWSQAAFFLAAGAGSPMFGGVENVFSSILFGIPAVKAVEFGDGFACCGRRGSENNDSFYYNESRQVKTRTNHCGGILGGITNGMPILFRVGIKPTASIGKEQDTIDLSRQENAKLVVKGRHDPCIVPRAVPVVEAAAAAATLDLLLERGSL